MSDEGPSVKKQKIFGSLADIDTVKRIVGEGGHTSYEKGERMTMDPAESQHEKEVLAEFERRKRARTLTLPTDDVQVKLKLRMLSQPICLFGEDILDRRERLRALLSTMSEDEITSILHSHEAELDRAKDDRDSSTWYHHGPPSLRNARLAIADFSLRKAKERLARQKDEVTKPQQEKALKRQETQKWIQGISLHSSQVADTRPVSFVEFSPDGSHIVSAGWSGMAAVYRREDCNRKIRYAGHNAQCGCARFHPGAFVSNDEASLNVASCGHDGSLTLWSLDSEKPLAQLENHGARIARIAFHPSGRFLASCCFDSSWRLNDVEVGEEILFQEGHSRAVFDCAFHPDGSLALTAGNDCYGRVWDLRTGRCVMFMDGHQKEIHSVEFHPNGWEMLTGSADNTVKIWDLRIRRCLYTLAAHKSLVSRTKIDQDGMFLVTSSFDNTLKLWSTTGWQPLRELIGHDTKVMCVDVSPDGKWIASAAFDRTFKLWTNQGY